MAMPTCRAADQVEKVAAADGVRLAVERYLARPVERGAAVFIHGFSAYGGLFRHVAAALADAGWTTTLFDCRGHGLSEGKRGHVASFRDFTDDLGRLMALARERSPGKPLVVVAHSHGATIALDLILGGGARPDLMVLVTPFFGLSMKVPAWKQRLASVMERVWPSLPFGNELASERATRDPDVARVLDADPLVHHVASPRWYNETRRAQARILAAAAKFDVPALLLLAGDELVVDNALSTAFFERCRGAGHPIEMRVIPAVRHEIFLEPERDAVLAEMTAWIATHAVV